MNPLYLNYLAKGVAMTNVTHIGISRVRAERMTRAEYNIYRGWPLPANENGDDAGYLVEEFGTDLNMDGRTGYISWLPEQRFMAVYRPTTELSFGMALYALTDLDVRVRRRGWNGKGMWIAATCLNGRSVPTTGFWSKHNAAHAASQGGSAIVLPSMTMKTATGELLMGWTPNALDLMSNDWEIVPTDIDG